MFFILKYFVVHEVMLFLQYKVHEVMADQYKIPYLNAVIRMFGNRFDLTVQQLSLSL